MAFDFLSLRPITIENFIPSNGVYASGIVSTHLIFFKCQLSKNIIPISSWIHAIFTVFRKSLVALLFCKSTADCSHKEKADHVLVGRCRLWKHDFSLQALDLLAAGIVLLNVHWDKKQVGKKVPVKATAFRYFIRFIHNHEIECLSDLDNVKVSYLLWSVIPADDRTSRHQFQQFQQLLPCYWDRTFEISHDDQLLTL